MRTPDHFVIIGAQRCGTTYLYGVLDEHPDIEMAKPMRPEPKFFLDDERYGRGLGYYESEYFSGATRVRGEKSTSYIESEIAAQRVKAMLPEALVVVVVRDPVLRAVSNYRFTAAAGNEDLPLDEALRASVLDARPWDRNRFSASPYAYLPRGRYADYLESFARHVPKDQIHVVVFEELVEDAGVISALFTRLGVDPAFVPARIGVVVNATEPADEPLGADLVDWLRYYYREPNERLEEFLGRELSWTAE